MKSLVNCSLKSRNTFAVESHCPNLYMPETIADLKQLAQMNLPAFYILGEGSNTLFLDEQAPVIIQPNFRGIEVSETSDHYMLEAGCAENWHQLVSYCVDHGYGGLENLALIPGSVGAAPIQNIGAYGVELADVLHSVTWFDFASQQIQQLSVKQCQLGYRDSIFKHQLKAKGIIVAVTLVLNKRWRAKLNYAGLDQLPESASPAQIFTQVIAIRTAKLPDPKDKPNAGSFFKNPIVAQAQFQQLKKQYPDIVAYPLADDRVKLAAAWLIDQAGFKGVVRGKVGVHDRQALVLVNYQQGSGAELLALAKEIQAHVKQRFAIELQPEVRMVSQNPAQVVEDEHG